jgi:LacI family transcriptional regulator
MLVTGRSQTIGLILSRPDLVAVDAFVPPMMLGLNEVCLAHDYRLLMEAVRDPESPDAYLHLAKSKRIDGLIVINPRKGDVALRKIIESKFPILIFGSSGNPNENSIGTEDKEASCQATAHLLSLGHRRIAHISYASLVHVPAYRRFEGYRNALRAANVSFNKKLFAEGDFTCESGYLAMRKILAAGTKPTAVFAGNDTLALGAMAAVREAGLSIPEEFAVVGYDDIPAAAFAFPPLTTVRSLAFEQGKIAGEAVIDLINGKEQGRKTSILPLELVIRDSCGAKGSARETVRYSEFRNIGK